MSIEVIEQIIEIPVKEGGSLGGMLVHPRDTKGVVIFAHGSGSGRLSPRNQFVAHHLNEGGFSTLLFDLLTSKEEADDPSTGLRFDIELLASRLILATDWVREHFKMFAYPFGYFGASTGAAAACVAATKRPFIKAIVSRGGRPDLAGASLEFVEASTLFIVGESDREVLELNKKALERIPAVQKELEIVPGATHLFEEEGALEAVADCAFEWFQSYLVDLNRSRS